MKPHSKDLRCGRWSEIGRPYHITTATLDRQHVFSDLHPARVLIQALKASDNQGRTETLAFVVMPDHLHWLFILKVGRLQDAVGAVKSVTAHRLHRPIWQDAYHDHALRQEEDLRDIARYIVRNPLRAGLVKSLGDYPHWDAKWLQ
jgi:putative transposase